MGLFTKKKLIGTVEITHYGQDLAKISYTADTIDEEQLEDNKVTTFAMYLSKMLFNLGKSDEADKLIEKIHETATETIKEAMAQDKQNGSIAIIKSGIKRLDLLKNKPKLVNNEDSKEIDEFFKKIVFDAQEGERLQKTATNNIKRYKGELYEKSDGSIIIQTTMSKGEERFYTPLSVMVFLQYLINGLSVEMLAYLMSVIQFMKQYYMEIGDYTNITSIIKAPEYGFERTDDLFAQ